MKNGVVTKGLNAMTVGNDKGVVTKRATRASFGNDSIGFIRRPKRKLKGGAPGRPSYYYKRALTSVSFDLVRAVPVSTANRAGEFVLGLGSLKGKRGEDEGDLMWFWTAAIQSAGTSRAGREAAASSGRSDGAKGAPLPTAAECIEFGEQAKRFGWEKAVKEISKWL